MRCVRFVQRGSLWDMLRRAQADPSQLPWSRRLKFAAEVLLIAALFSQLRLE
jgi:hypothetical protein